MGLGKFPSALTQIKKNQTCQVLKSATKNKQNPRRFQGNRNSIENAKCSLKLCRNPRLPETIRISTFTNFAGFMI